MMMPLSNPSPAAKLLRRGGRRPVLATALSTVLFTALAGVLCTGTSTKALAQEGGFRLSSDEPVQIQADRLDVQDNEGRAVFEGNVEVVQGELSLRASRMTVLYRREGDSGGVAGGLGSAGNIKRIDASGGVSVRSGQQVATGDEGSFDMASEVVILTGDEVVLSDAGNVITGCRLTIGMRTGDAQVEPCGSGRIKLLLEGNAN